MRIWLMNREHKIMLMEYDTQNKIIYKVIKILDIRYAPLAVYEAYYDKSKKLSKAVNDWFRGRGIPSWRKDLQKLLERLNVNAPEELIDQAYGLSLSDQYWVKDEKSEVCWKDINFFDNDFDYMGYLEASLSSSEQRKSVSLHSPNNTTDGMIQKGWIIHNGTRILVKGTYYASREEPINEWLASAICERLGFDHCPYKIEVLHDQIVSVCPNFIASDEEIVSAYDIYQIKKKPNHMNDYEHYISILEAHGVPEARKNVENMFILDYLIMNEDRHMKNFGVIRNAETLKWERTTPIFDSGESMQCDRLTAQLNFNDGKGKFFMNTGKDYEKIIDTLGNGIKRVDCTKLKNLSDEYRQVMKKYQLYTDASDQRIDKLAAGLDLRIKRLSKKIKGIPLI